MNSCAVLACLKFETIARCIEGHVSTINRLLISM